jgi:ABC-type Fe3+/spermidine/putrescine transport system ATPase subunit
MSLVETFYRDLGHFKIQISNWEILDQGVTLLWGPSGAGKSTIVKGLVGLDPLAQVVWNFQGKDIASLPLGQRGISVVFQDLYLFPHMTVAENILFPVSKRLHQNWQSDYEYLVQSFQLAPILKSPSAQISGGEAQRVALARSLIIRPKQLILDEPLSSLSIDLKVQIRKIIKQVCIEIDCPILLVSHDPADKRELADKVTHIDRGQIF